MTVRLSIPLAALFLLPLAASAQSAPGAAASRPGGHGFEPRFQAANVTHDGHLTLEQARNGHMPSVVRHFAEIDQSHLGYVTLADIQAYRRQVRAANPPQ